MEAAVNIHLRSRQKKQNIQYTPSQPADDDKCPAGQGNYSIRGISRSAFLVYFLD